MTTINCTLECGHVIVWGEQPEMPGAALPHVAQVVYCNDCESDTDIADCNPSQIIVEQLDLKQFDYPGSTATRAAVFFDCPTGTWGYSLCSMHNNLYTESDDILDYDSLDSARQAAIEAAEEDKKSYDDDADSAIDDEEDSDE